MRPVVFLLVILVFASCTIRDKKEPEPPAPLTNSYAPFYQQIQEGKMLLKDGDLVVRSGNDITSQLIKDFNRKDKNYSHSGIVFFVDSEPMIYHILAGAENPDAKMVADSLENFSAPRQNFGFAIYRYDLDSFERKKMKELVISWYNKGTTFDSLFNFKTDDRMYCSEMITKGLERSTQNRIKIETVKPTKSEALLAATRLPLSVKTIMNLDIIPIDNLYTNPHCRLVHGFDFNYQR